ncbi:hypothetical protein A8990_1822 [Paenibacillus taihuensis]|uniref:Helix-turn-helix protein n=1 Tax=Paenibacillus taihuensis TaxID=1156355 RepID=A0A3D9PW25_9BACL|nr:hypothetical protein [Paenibacillus taihuensis]REE54709.1 hypothetical protein A8990_1822 [Paenibacillus taihuensis]
MARIPILGSGLNDGDELNALRSYYAQWRQNNSVMKSPFFALFKSFKELELLKNLDEGALRLYLYFGFVAGNENGVSWHSIQTIADYFDKQTRTIDGWIHKLVEAGLIYRTKDDKKSHTTFLIPYTNSILNLQPKRKHEADDQALIQDLVTSLKELAGVYGEIINVVHIFHWARDGRSKQPTHEQKPVNFLLFITKRTDGVLIGHRHHLRKSDKYGISQLYIDEVAVFDSPFLYKDKPVAGIAVKETYRLRSKDSIETLLGMVQDLAGMDEDVLLQHAQVEYGLISDVLVEDEEEEPEEQEAENDEGGED